ncbi:MAG: BlaI/MecI/CopY family transcriptional regulator [Aureispira sp.]
MNKLTRVEEEIMHIIWKLERCTVRDVIEQLPQTPKPPHSTISSVVRILEKKGFLDHKAYGRTYEYFPIIEKEAYSKENLTDLLRNYFGGSAKRLVSFLVNKEDLSVDDLSEMAERLEEHKNKEEDSDASK